MDLARGGDRSEEAGRRAAQVEREFAAAVAETQKATPWEGWSFLDAPGGLEEVARKLSTGHFLPARNSKGPSP